MNIYLFWTLFLALLAIVPLMIIKGRTDDKTNIKTSPEVKNNKKGWFSQFLVSQFLSLFNSSLEKKLKINNEIIEAKYPEIFRNGGSINGRTIIILNEGFIFS